MSGSRIGRALRASGAYFAWVFAAGFALGWIRVPLLEPRLGTRWSELAELPLMLVAVVLAARWTVRRFRLPPEPGARWTVGLVALGGMLLAELGVLVVLRGLPLHAFLTARDPVSGPAYFAALALFGAMPRLLLLRPQKA